MPISTFSWSFRNLYYQRFFYNHWTQFNLAMLIFLFFDKDYAPEEKFAPICHFCHFEAIFLNSILFKFSIFFVYKIFYIDQDFSFLDLHFDYLLNLILFKWSNDMVIFTFFRLFWISCQQRFLKNQPREFNLEILIFFIFW